MAPLSDSRGFGLSAHVESAGDHLSHFTHDEASCAACSVLSLHALTSHPAAVPVPPGKPVFRPVTTAEASIEARPLESAQPRAPPAFV